MNVLLTGANGYIGKRLLPELVARGHFVYCCVRDRSRFTLPDGLEGKARVIEADFLQPGTLDSIPEEIDAAFYLIHSMSSGTRQFDKLEAEAAGNFRERISSTGARQVIYLGGIANDNSLSRHLASRRHVETILSAGEYSLTVLRAGIIIGSGSASFEIIRDLVEKLPVMVAPKWILTRSQPIAIADVLRFLCGVLGNEPCYGQVYDIAGTDILSYRDMMQQYGEVRGLKRLIITVPVMTPRLSSYWLYFVTSISYKLAVNLVNSMKVEVIAKENNLAEMLKIQPLSYREAVSRALVKISSHEVVSSWKDALITSRLKSDLPKFLDVPVHGCYKDYQQTPILREPGWVLMRFWSIGGDTGWYYANWLWQFRGFLDRLVGGCGLRRGRTHPTEIHEGDALDFWRVLIAEKKNMHLLLFAEMKLPGEAWLEFFIRKESSSYVLHQVTTFRPRGVWGRLYWMSTYPFHFFIFRGLLNRIAGK